jgi:tetratricopeptide (TPR) repeat protein
MSEQLPPEVLEVERARALIGLGRFDGAVTALHQLLGRDPENGLGWCLLAQAQLGRGDPQTALEAADRAVAVAPESNWAHRLRSIALGVQGDHEGGVAAALEAIRLAPNDWQGYACLARLLTQIKARRGEAISAAEYAVALAPNESDAHLTLGIAAAANGKRKEAEAAFRDALAIDPQDSEAHNELARLKLRKSRFAPARLADAAGGFQTAVQADPHASVSRHNLELTLRTFLSRLSYLIFIVAWVCARALTPVVPASAGTPASPPPGNGHITLLILALLCAPATYGWRFVSRLNPDLRQHLRYTITHGRIATVAAIQLFAILLLLYTAVASPSNPRATAAAAFCLTLVARLLLVNDIYKLTGRRLISSVTLWIIAAGFALIAVLFGFGAAESGFGTRGAMVGLVSGALCLTMIYMIRRRRA